MTTADTQDRPCTVWLVLTAADSWEFEDKRDAEDWLDCLAEFGAEAWVELIQW